MHANPNRRRTVLAAILALALVSPALADQPPTGTAAQEPAEESRGREIVAPPGTNLGLPFSAGVLAGDFLYLSGAIGNQPGTTEVTGDVKAQTRRTLENLEAVLDAAGLDFSRVVQMHLYLADVRHFPAVLTVWREVLGDVPVPPAGVAVEADVAIPGALTEIAMVAARPGVELRRVTPEGWPESPTSSWGVLAGDTLFLSGASAYDPATGKPVAGDAATQTKRAMENVGAVLEAAEMDFGDLATCRVFLTDARDYEAMNGAYGAFFPEAPPARATVRADFVHPGGFLVQVACVAARGAERRVVAPPGGGAGDRPFSPAIQVGDRLFLAGMVGRGEDGYPPSVAEQTRLTLKNLRATLHAAGMDFADVATATVFLADIRHYAAMNEAYRDLVGTPPPARATVGTRLMSPEALVEIQMTAVAHPETRRAASSPTPPGD